MTAIAGAAAGSRRGREVRGGEGSHPAIDLLERRGLMHRTGAAEPAGDGWSAVECTIAGDPSRSAEVLRLLLIAGVEVARLERVELSLADLITRIIGADSEGAADA